MQVITHPILFFLTVDSTSEPRGWSKLLRPAFDAEYSRDALPLSDILTPPAILKDCLAAFF